MSAPSFSATTTTKKKSPKKTGKRVIERKFFYFAMEIRDVESKRRMGI